MDAYAANLLFKSLKLHFTTEAYDYFKYNGKVKDSKALQQKFLQNNQRFYFAKLAKHENPEGLVVANLLIDPKMFIGDVVSPEGLLAYSEWKGRQARLSYLFTEEMTTNDNYKNILKRSESGLPFLIHELIGRRLTPEVVIMVDGLIGRLDKWSTDQHPLMQKIQLRLRKYRPFVKYDKDKAKATLQKLIQAAA